MAAKRARMEIENSESPSFMSLPDNAIHNVLRHLDGRSLVAMEAVSRYFTHSCPSSRLSLTEAVAREALLSHHHGALDVAARFRNRSWKERHHLEFSTGADFDRAVCEGSGFSFRFTPDGKAMRSVKLLGMGPKLLVSGVSTADQPVLRWRLRVKGNTAVEFGVIPAGLEPAPTALHKCMAAPSRPAERSQGFCSQITAGSLLPLKAPVMRGTVLDVVARRGRVEVVLTYPADAKEISWHGGQPVQRPYRGPSQVRLETDFPPDYDVRLAVTAWAKAHFEVLHAGFDVDPAWASEALSAERAGLAAEAAAVPAAAASAAAGEAQLLQAAAAAAGAVAVDSAAVDGAALSAALSAVLTLPGGGAGGPGPAQPQPPRLPPRREAPSEGEAMAPASSQRGEDAPHAAAPAAAGPQPGPGLAAAVQAARDASGASPGGAAAELCQDGQILEPAASL